MINHLLELLPELIEHVCSYCSVSDIISISCCNKEYNYFFRPIIWRVVEMPWAMNSFLPPKKQSLEFTRSLSFSYSNDFKIESPNERWGRVKDIFITILNRCTIERLNSLKIESIFSDIGLQFTRELLPNLERLFLHKCNDITEFGWRVVCTFPYLKHLEVFDCSIQDDDLKEIVKNIRLQKLVVSHCRDLSSICLQHVSNFASLSELSFSCWRFKESNFGFNALSVMSTLKRLRITGYYNASNTAITLLNSLNSLVELDLSCCSNLNDSGLARISLILNLQSLTVSDCGKLTDNGFTALTVLSNLRTLNISGCWKLTDSGLTNLTILYKLEEMNIGGCRFISDVGINALRHVRTLRKLIITGCCYVTDVGISFLSQLTLLNELFIGGCHVTDLGISQLTSLPRLVRLNTSECNKITDYGIHAISQIKSLKCLNIQGCKEVTFIGLTYLTRLSLNELNIKNCQLSDEKVKQFCNMSGMRELLGTEGNIRSRILTSNHRMWSKQIKQKYQSLRLKSAAR